MNKTHRISSPSYFNILVAITALFIAFCLGRSLVITGYKLTLFIAMAGSALVLGLIDLKKFFCIYILIKPVANYFLELREAIPQMERASTLGIDGMINLIFIFCTMAYFALQIIRKRGIKLQSVHKLLIVFLILCVLSALRASDLLYSLRGLVRYFGFAAVVFVVSGLFKREDDIKSLVKLWLLSGIVPILIGFYQLIFTPDALGYRNIGYGIILRRVESTFGHAPFFGMYLSFIIILLVCTGLYRRKLSWMVYSLAACILLTATISRNPWITTGVALISAMLMQKKYLYAVVATTVFIVIFLSVPTLHEPFKHYSYQRVLEESASGSLEDRTVIWRTTIRHALRNSIILGRGPQTFFIVYGDLTNRFVGPHNTYLEVLVEEGLPALLVYVFILIYALKLSLVAYKNLLNANLKSIALAVSGCIVATCVLGLADNVFHLAVYFWVAMILGIAVSLNKLAEAGK